MSAYILVFDQSTTSSSAFAFDIDGTILANETQAFQQYFPHDGWVEHDAQEIWQSVLTAGRKLLQRDALIGRKCLGVGITNQRETTVLWDRKTGVPIHKAIVWQDRRTAETCQALARTQAASIVPARTGLLLDPYFSATKIAWTLDNVPGARAAADAGELAFGTMETWLIWNLTGGRHVSDYTNASRTSLLNIETGQWDEDLLRLFNVPKQVLPELSDNVAHFGDVLAEHFDLDVPIWGAIGDQQGASFGQCCFDAGMIKSTYGTGCFVLVNTGTKILQSENRLLSTIAYSLNGERQYALEGSIFMAGAIVQWLRDDLNLFKDARETQTMATAADPASRVIMVPAFTGLGAPYWEPDARAAILGLTRDSGANEIVRAALESVALQTRDLLDAISSDLSSVNLQRQDALRVDGGMVANDWFMQNLGDLTGQRIERSAIFETTALGAASLVMLGAGVCKDMAELSSRWLCDGSFEPRMTEVDRQAKYADWKAAVAKVIQT
jgi:glycerol kinase